MEQPAEQDPLIGLTIGNYEIKKKLGEGGMGCVYLAEHPLIGKQVALKVLHAEFASNRDVVARFFTEAKSVNDIQHPNIVDIVDYGEIVHESGTSMVYFIMEFLAGESLAQLIHREAPMAPERALSICMQIADALGASHKHGVVHRDLKPDNVILIQRGRQADFAKVLDFGIAKLTGDQPGSRRTRTGIVMGTPAYMSPEQCEGRGNVDSRTDIYALGILLYEMITGRVPFLGEGYGEVLVQHLTQVPTRPTTIRGVIPPHVEAICMKALEKRPESRYPSMEEFMRALQDPVGYVEAHGGINGFSESQIQDSGEPAPDYRTPTPSPIAPLTPAPGTISPLTPGVGQSTPTQVTAPGANTPYGQQNQMPTSFPDIQPGGGRRIAVIAGIVVVVLGIAAGAFFGLKGGSSDSSDEPEKHPVAAVDPDVKKDPVPEVKKDPVPEVKKDPVPEVKKDPILAKPEMVRISADSKPTGAKVYVGKEKKSRGKTPISFKLEKSDKPVKITFRIRRYRQMVKTITPNGNNDLDVILKRSKRTGRGDGKTGKDKPGGKAGDYTVNPFGP